MATAFQPPSTQHTLYRSHSISPASSTPTTPQASSPTSPHSSLALSAHSRPLRPANPPLYVPAALRPSRPPRRKLSPPTSQTFDSPPLTRTNSDTLSWHDPAPSEWSVKEDIGEPPSREHWKPDAAAPVCDAPTCTRAFTYFTRRHHCRRCGDVFCDAHSAHLVPLDAAASFRPGAHPSRACDFCWGEYARWEVAGGSRGGSSRSGSDDDSESGGREVPGTPGIDCARPVAAGGGFFDAKVVRGAQPGSVAASVPRDWNWSTF